MTDNNTPKTHPMAPSVQVRAVDETFTTPVVLNESGVVPAATTPTAMPTTGTLTQAQQIWNEIQNKQLELFALPAQLVSKYFTPVSVEPSRLYLDNKGVGATIPALETALGSKFAVELMDRFVVVSVRVPGLQK
jgi:hypothetical protein